MAELVPNPKFLYFYKRKTLTEKLAHFCPPQTIYATRWAQYEKNSLDSITQRNKSKS